MSWTKSGTISLTNNSAIVYGAGTTWASSNLVRGGDILKAPDGKDYEVLSVQSNTQLTLATPYLGSTASGQAYALIHTGLLPAELAVDVSDLQSKYLVTVSQLYEWETSTADTVPLTNPATGVTTNVKPIAQMMEDMATPTITGGSINNAPIGQSTPAAGAFTTLSASGNAWIGGVTPSAWESTCKVIDIGTLGAVGRANSGQTFLGYNFYINASGQSIYKTTTSAAKYEQVGSEQRWSSAPSGTAGQPITFTQAMTLDANGNLLVGVASATCHTLLKNAQVDGMLVASIYGGGNTGAWFYGSADVSGIGNAANALLKLGRSSNTGRSLGAVGTLNASGADYAEYENNNGLVIAKGSIVGFKSDGTLTLNFADAIRFGIKSTDPSYVGGDTWGSEEQVGKRPEKPVYTSPIYEGAPNPGDKPAEPALSLPPAPTQQDGETDETFAIRTAQWQEYCATATTVHQAALASYAEALAAWDAANAAWQDDDASYQGKVSAMQSAHEYAMARYEEALADFEVRLEAARQQVDRVAYSGKVPVNVMGATPGGYIVPVEGADGQIAGEFVADPDFAQYKRAVGRVNRILEDGRCEVAVMVH